MQTLIWAILGAVAGSAANAVIDRLPRRESWLAGRSHCDACGHTLRILDLIPGVSYLALGGKCRYCHSRIPLRNLLVEIFLGLSFMVINGHSWSLMLILWVTTVIAVMDWENMLVSDYLVALWAILVVLSIKYQVSSIYGLLVGVGVIGGLWLLTKKKGMGEGDIGIAAVAGWWLGWPKIAPALWISFVAGAAFGIWQLAIGKKKMKSQIAFGPWLILGAWIGYVWGDKILKYVFHT